MAEGKTAEKISLLIVDDEEYVLDGLRRHIDWGGLGIEVVGGAGEGEEGFRKAMELRPDLVMTDIRMPQLDGISMIERLHARGFHPHFLLYTGYNDFEYAKRAIKFGVSDYILKPSLPEEISAALSRMADKCREQKRMVRAQEQLRGQFENDKRLLIPAFIGDLFGGKIFSHEEFERRDRFLGTGMAGKSYCAVALYVDPSSELFENAEVERQLYVLYQVSNYAAEVFQTGVRNLGFRNNDEFLLVVGDPSDMAQQALLEKATLLLDYCTSVQGLTVVVGIGDLVEGYERIPETYRQARDCVRNSVVSNTVVFRGSGAEDEQFCPPLGFIYDKEALVDAVKTANREQTFECLGQFFAGIKRIGTGQDLCVAPLFDELIGSVTTALLQIGVDYDPELFRGLMEPVQTTQQLQDRTEKYFDDLLGRVRGRHFAKNYQMIQRMLAYVRENYGKGITLNEVADALHFTPNYLSTLFSKSTGESFSHYLLRYRIQKAKEFLDSGKYKVYEVGDIVGYRNSEYFSKVFKDIVGVPPSAYVK